MKKRLLYFICLVGCIPFLAAAAQKGENNLKVAYVSVNEAVEKTGEKARIGRALEKERKRIENVLFKKSEVFKKQAVKIQQEMSLLSDSEKAKKYESIQKMRLMMEQFAKEKDMEFQNKKAELETGVVGKIKNVVDIVAKKKKVDVVRNRDGALWVNPQLDLTSNVVKMYKKKYKK